MKPTPASPPPTLTPPPDTPTQQEIDTFIQAAAAQLPHLHLPSAIVILYRSLVLTAKSNISTQLQAASERPYKQPYFRCFPVITDAKPYSEGEAEKPKISEQVYNRFQRDKPQKQVNYAAIATDCIENYNRVERWLIPVDKMHSLIANKLAPKFSCRDDELRYFEKRLSAKVYCDRPIDTEFDPIYNEEEDHLEDNHLNAVTRELASYGLKEFRDKRRYKTVSTAFIGEAYRRFQLFLQKNCEINLRPLSSPAMRALYCVLANAKGHLGLEQYRTFRKFLKITFDLGSVSVYERSCKSLYLQMQSMLRERMQGNEQQWARSDWGSRKSEKSEKSEMQSEMGQSVGMGVGEWDDIKEEDIEGIEID